MADPQSIKRARNRINNQRWCEQHRDRKREQALRYYRKQRATELARRALLPPKTTKRCARCAVEKPFGEFYTITRQGKQSLHSYCKVCLVEQRKVWNSANREKKHAGQRTYYLANRRAIYDKQTQLRRKQRAEHPERIQANRRRWRKQWRLRNPMRARERDRLSRARNRETVLACIRRWSHSHRNVKRALEMSRRAKKRAAFIEHVDPAVVFARDGGTCQLCRQPIGADRWHIDHRVPLAKGGEHAYSNVQLAHAVCNVRKGARLVA